MAESPRICFITPGHIASNPRLVKEASAASAAGYRVRIVFSQYMTELAPADESILSRHPEWTHEAIDWRDAPAGRRLRRQSALRQRLSRGLFHGLGTGGVHALNRVYSEELRAAKRDRADLYVAHNPGALPVAVAAAEHWGVAATFDAEDFHRGDVADARAARLIEWAESRFMPRVAALTAASDGIAAAYVRCLGVDRPATVLNVFEQSERDAEVPAELLAHEREDDGRSIYWFSQTIGPNRGLEDAVDALAHLPKDVHLYLRGMWAAGYESSLRARAARQGVGDRVHARKTALPHHLVRLAACHDVGLALELPLNANKQLCVSNKLFTYLLAGVPVAMSATDGQRDVSLGFRAAVRLYEPGNSTALADAIRELLDNRTAETAALDAALTRYSWDVEQHRFLSVVERLIGSPRVLAASHA